MRTGGNRAYISDRALLNKNPFELSIAVKLNEKRLSLLRKTQPFFVCLDVSSYDTSSGGGIRTPDTRIMIPLL